MKYLIAFFSLTINTFIGGGLVYAESTYNVCPDWQLFEYYDSATNTKLDTQYLQGVWELMDVKTAVDLQEPGEPEFLEVYLEQIKKENLGGPLIEVDGDQVTPEELEEMLMNDI